MKNLILLFGLVLIFSCQKKENDFPKNLEELIDFENRRIEKEVEECESDIAKLVCKGKWKLDSFGFEKFYPFIANDFKFECEGTYSYNNSKNFSYWKLNSDTITLGCFYQNDSFRSYFAPGWCSAKHDYLIIENKDSLIIQLINPDLILHKIEGGFICNCPASEWNPLEHPSILPYLDSLNSK